MRSLIYCRLSVNRDSDMMDIQRQLKVCRTYAQAQGWSIVGEYLDNNKSAWHEGSRRSGFEGAKQAIVRGEADVILALDIDRFSRRIETLLPFLKFVSTHNVRAWSVKTGELATDTSKATFFTQLQGILSEFYVNDMQEKSKAKRAELARQGVRHFTSRIYGWEEDGIKIREDEAVVIREITQRLIDGDTGTHIARDLNARGILTVKGAQWTGIGVKVCARRASNAGLRSHHGELYEGTWQAIVTREQWERVCAVVERPVTAWKRGKGRKYPFTGFVVCGLCKQPLSVAMGRSNAGQVAYRCDSRRRGVEIVRAGCGGVMRGQVPVDYLIKEALIARLDGDGLHRALGELASKDAAVAHVLEELRGQRERLDGFVDDYASGLLDRQQFARSKAIAESRIAELERQAAQLSGAGALRRADFSKGIRHMIESADVYLLRDIAELLIKEVRIMPQPKKGFQVKILEIDGRDFRFDSSLVELEWLV